MSASTMASYDAAFFDYVNSGSIRSARLLLPLLTSCLSIRSVLDVGCGQGAWLSVWRELGVEDVLGIDGEYVDKERLLIPEGHFEARDLAREFRLSRRFDLVQSLEVAEHLPSERSADLVYNLVGHGDLILFSAAVRGQGGHHHVNEQDYGFWRTLFAAHGYEPFDYLRPRLRSHSEVEPWYRYNTLLYASQSRRLPPEIQECRIRRRETIPDVSPPLYQVRKRLVRLLPVPLMTAVSRIRQRLVARIRAAS